MKPKTVTVTETIWMTFIGFIAGVIICYSIFVKQPNSVCELELPRNEYCEMISVPVEKSNE